MKEFMAEEMAEANKIKADMAKKRGVANSAAHMAASLEDLEDGELPMVKIGDASIAAPFTSKMPSIRSCTDIIRQGRCTLVTTLQMYQVRATATGRERSERNEGLCFCGRGGRATGGK